MRNKILIIHKLQICLQRSQNLEFFFRLRKDENNADLCQKKQIKLKNKIDNLIERAIDDWLLDANNTIDRINKANLKLKNAINNIENDIDVANNVLKAISQIDDVIAIATHL